MFNYMSRLTHIANWAEIVAEFWYTRVYPKVSGLGHNEINNNNKAGLKKRAV
jgi:hypothetical protein